jgi:hypothetical protein
MSAAAAGGLGLLQRYELAAVLCAGLRVLDLSDAPDSARLPLRSSASDLVAREDAEPSEESFDAVVALDGLPTGERRDRALSVLERRALAGARVLVAFERPDGRPKSPRVEVPFGDAARALAEKLPGALVLPQFVAEGALIGPLHEADRTPELDLRLPEQSDEDAAALIVASGFERNEVNRVRASLRVAAAPVLLGYVRELELANAELLRANRGLMRASLGRDGSAAGSLASAQRKAEEMQELARRHELQARQVEAWYDAPRYHLADRVRDVLTKIPGLTGLVRFLWSLVSTRAETPHIDAAANPPPEDERSEAERVTREREGLAKAEVAREPEEISSRLEG